MDNLYSHRCGVCGGFHNELEDGLEFSKKVLAKMLRDIYDGLDVKEKIQKDAFEETLRIFNKATATGLSESEYPTMDELFLEQIRTNNEVFSAFRTHRMQNDLANRLVDSNGRLKPFEKWVADVKDITDHYCIHWLRTEYDTAVLRAHQAADWKHFEQNADVLPNVRWMPTTSPQPDNYHRQYWQAKLTLPVNHPFWKSHRPGDRWNCKCSLLPTDEPATTGVVADFEPVPEVPGLDNNPADDGKLFSDSHPYIKEAYSGAKEAVQYLLENENSYQIIPTKSGRLRIHKGHGKNERKENIRIGTYFAEKYGYEIDLLDNPQDIKSADSYNWTLKVQQEYKINATPTKSSIDNLLRDAKKQANDIVLWIDSDISWKDLTAAVRPRVKRSENITHITIVRDGKDIRLSREDILTDNFKIRPADLK